MNPKTEFALILLVSFVLPVTTYAVASNLMENAYWKAATPITEALKTDHKPPSKILFVGDIMLDRDIRLGGERKGYDELFSCLPDMLAGYDRVIGNLEGTITDNQSVSAGAPYESPESFRFTFDVDAVRALKQAGLTTVSIANNHIRDFGNDGIAQTVANLTQLGIPYFGDPRSDGQKYVVEDIKGTRVAFVGHNQFFGTKEETLAALSQASAESDLQVVFPHWGDEYVPVRPDVRQLAHEFVDAGADLIIGAHPHVIQEDEIYNDVAIYYSLGNFIFDQYWEPAVSTGMMVEIEIIDKQFSIGKKIQTQSIRHSGTCLK